MPITEKTTSASNSWSTDAFFFHLFEDGPLYKSRKSRDRCFENLDEKDFFALSVHGLCEFETDISCPDNGNLLRISSLQEGKGQKRIFDIMDIEHTFIFIVKEGEFFWDSSGSDQKLFIFFCLLYPP